ETSISVRMRGSSSLVTPGFDDGAAPELLDAPRSILTTMDLGMVSVLPPMVYSTRPFLSLAESTTMRVPLLSTMVSARTISGPATQADTIRQQNGIIVRKRFPSIMACI